MAPYRQLVTTLLVVLCVTKIFAIPHRFKKRNQKQRIRREEIQPDSNYYNPGSEEVSRLAFEQQNAETPSKFYQSNVPVEENQASYQGYQDSDAMKAAEAAAFSHENDAEDAERKFLDQSEVQKSNIGNSEGEQVFGGYGVEAERTYESEAGFNRPQASAIQRNPFDMPVGYPDQDGYKKSIVAKQILPLNEPHPENKTGEAPSVSAGLALAPNAQPAEYKVQVTGNKNENGYVTTSQVEARYPIGQLPSYPPQTAYYQNGSAPAAQKPATNNQPVSSVQYVVPAPEKVYDQSTAANLPQQQPPQQQPQPQLQPPQQQDWLLYKQSQPQQPQQQAQPPPQPAKQPNDILDLKLEKRPLPQVLPPPQPQPQPQPQKVPSAKNYPIDLIFLNQPRPTGLKLVKTDDGHKLVAKEPAEAPKPVAGPPAEQPPIKPATQVPVVGPQLPMVGPQPKPIATPAKPIEFQPKPVAVLAVAVQPNPAASQPQPAVAQQKLAESQPQPATAQQRPAESQPKPIALPAVAVQQKPAEPLPKPAEQQPTPAQPQPAQPPQKPELPPVKPPQALPIGALPRPDETQTKPLGPQGSLASPPQATSAQQQPQAAPQAVPQKDDSYCVNFPLSRCKEDWLQKNCQNKCKGANTTCAVPTTGGNSNSGCCKFPFVYNGQPYSSCIMSPGQTYWCSTTLNFDKDKQWGFCPGCSQWSEWTTCDKSCQGGKKYRYRNCNKLVVVKAVEIESQPCNNTNKCSPVCGNWTQWSECSATCGYGFKQRFRNCTLDGQTKVFVDRKYCYVADCPADCKTWSSWSACSKSCGNGTQARYRNCTLTNGHESFSRVFYEQRLCNPDPCPPDCQPWSSWTPCTKPCGEGTQYRYTNCTLDSGDKMTYYDHRVCNTQACPPVCGLWGKWSECTKTCGGGSQHRVRNCTIENQGKNSTFGEGEVQECNTEPCKPRIVCYDWGPWNECSATCGGGWKARFKNCMNPDGAVITMDDTAQCNTRPCQKVCGEWSAYSMCSVSCGGGITERWRTCDGKIDIENVYCNSFSCPTTAPTTTPTQITTTAPSSTCSLWSDWSECSATCNGMQSRIRHCKNATHEHDELQARPCNTLPCPGNVTTPTTSPTTVATTPTTQPTTTPTTQPPTTPTKNLTTTPAPTETTPKPPTGPYPECLLAYLSFDKIDAPNKIVYDEGPYHNDAQLDGNLTFVNGNFSCGYAVKLDGGEIMFDGSKFHPKPTTAITVAAWIYIESNTDRQTIFATRAGENGNDNFFLEVEQGKIRWYHISPAGHKVFFIVTESLLPAKTWVHVAGTYSVVTGEVKFFINAEESKITKGDGPLTQDWDNYAKIAGGGSGNQFRGLIDEFYIFNCSLVDEQVRVVADTCKLREGDECPSPLLGVCPPCDNCTTASPPTTPPIPEESSMTSNKSNNTKLLAPAAINAWPIPQANLNPQSPGAVNAWPILQANLKPQPPSPLHVLQAPKANFKPLQIFKAQNMKTKNQRRHEAARAGHSESDNAGKAMLLRSNFIFPWFKNVEAYRKKREV